MGLIEKAESDYNDLGKKREVVFIHCFWCFLNNFLCGVGNIEGQGEDRGGHRGAGREEGAGPPVHLDEG